MSGSDPMWEIKRRPLKGQYRFTSAFVSGIGMYRRIARILQVQSKDFVGQCRYVVEGVPRYKIPVYNSFRSSQPTSMWRTPRQVSIEVI